MADDPLLALQDSDYNSASDEEFDPTAAEEAAAEEAAADDASISSSGDEGGAKKSAKPAKKSGKRKRGAGDDDDELDSGDEATIAAARRRHQQQRGGNKKQRQEAEGDDDVELLSDDGGEGGLVKTRAQRRAEKKERRPLARVDGATADVDAIWAALSTVPVGMTNDEGVKGDEGMRGEEAGKGQEEAQDVIRPGEVEEEMITIKRTYDFAGDRITEERQVPKSSAEAKLYLAQQQEKLDKQSSSSKKAAESSATPDTDGKDITEGEGEGEQVTDKPAVRRPLHRPSRFDPNPTAEVKGLSPEKQLTWARRRALLDPAATTPLPASTTASAQDANAAAKKSREKAQKLNTVDKSRLDWAGYVDKEGIADELDEYGRAKEGYLGRMDFLNRVDERREEERRAAKAALRT